MVSAAVVKWIGWNFVANEVRFMDPMPAELREPLARWMVSDERMGWPSHEDALAQLDELYDFATTGGQGS